MPGTHALAGIYGNKNSFGAVMAVSILGALFLYTRDKILYRRYFMVAIFFLICDILSTSGTTITIGLIFFYIFSLHTLARRGGISRILAILGCIPLLGVAVMADVAPDALFGLLGKDADPSQVQQIYVQAAQRVREAKKHPGYPLPQS